MKTFSYLIPLILSILCILYLLFFPYQRNAFEYNFTAKVLAKEDYHNTITNALYLSSNTTHKEKLEAYEKYYYYISSQRNISIKIISNQIQQLKTNLLSDTGNTISCQIQKRKKTLLLTLSPDKVHKTKRIFLCLANQSSFSSTAQIQLLTAKSSALKPNNQSASNQNSATSKPDNQSASNQNSVISKPDKQSASNQNSVTPKPDKQPASSHNSAASKPDKQSASNHNSAASKPDNQSASSKPDNQDVISYKEAILHPQCLILPPGISKKIAVKNDTFKNSTKRFAWISTNPNSVTVKNGIITTHHTGTAIIYLKDKKHSKNTSSCFIRVLKNCEKNIF
ncbi:hypothetical protein D7V86_09270 [bacterium D16-51]|nr:hypothetical protein D7V96_09740 [bacterium D16-59]RKI60385.1 hypothetical protein D7V86_09270 [bacterium D16-51]